MAPSPSSPTPSTTTSTATTTSTTRIPSPAPSLIPPPVPVETHPNRGKPQIVRGLSDPSRLAPEDAYKPFSPPRLRPVHEISGSAAASLAAAALRPAVASLRAPPAIPPVAARLAEEKRRAASRRRKQPHVWKKLLWIKQHGFPDNYTDTETFLDHLQRNPRLRPYDFWPLVADSAVIVQHVASVAIYICAYAGIYQDRLSPVAVVTCGSVATIVGWVLWDGWIGQEELEDLALSVKAKRQSLDVDDRSSTSSGELAKPMLNANGHANGNANGYSTGSLNGRGSILKLSTKNLAVKNHQHQIASKHTQSLSKSSFQSISPIDALNENAIEALPNLGSSISPPQPPQSPSSSPSPTHLSHRSQARRKAFKSACLIYFALLGLSPILKSLTQSTSSDSIWALATWLLIINIFLFDYGSLYVPAKAQAEPVSPGPSNALSPNKGGPFHTSIRAPPFPLSLSTNAALMASTVLASRLVTTTAVFSLSLFSIQVFGLFPVFRRHLRHKSFHSHLLLTVGLVIMSTCGLGLILSQSYTHTYGDCGYCLGWIWHVILRSTIGLSIGGFSTAFVMGGCSWWLIGLQRYKNVVIGPWDPAKPVLAGGGYGRSRTGTD